MKAAQTKASAVSADVGGGVPAEVVAVVAATAVVLVMPVVCW
jgi:hypothetical protein